MLSRANCSTSGADAWQYGQYGAHIHSSTARSDGKMFRKLPVVPRCKSWTGTDGKRLVSMSAPADTAAGNTRGTITPSGETDVGVAFESASSDPDIVADAIAAIASAAAATPTSASTGLFIGPVLQPCPVKRRSPAGPTITHDTVRTESWDQTMTALSSQQAADLFRDEPHRYLDMGPGKGEVAHRVVGSGPDVLFVHGWPVSGATFRTLLPDLAPHLTCHVVDLPGAGQSRYDDTTELSIDNHIASVVRVIDELGLDDVAVVGHNSGGMIARHAVAGDRRLRALGLIDTEPPGKQSWRFRSFLAARHLPGFGAGLGWAAGKPKVRRQRLVLGDAFVDSSLLDGEFDEFFLRPLHESAQTRRAAIKILRTFDTSYVDDLGALQQQIEVPVRLVWGVDDVFFPIERARAMVESFPDADLVEIDNAGLFSHEERPAAVAAALLATLR